MKYIHGFYVIDLLRLKVQLQFVRAVLSNVAHRLSQVSYKSHHSNHHTHLNSVSDFALAICPINALAHFRHNDISAAAVDEGANVRIRIRKEKG